MDSAYILFQEAGLIVKAPPTENRRFTLSDRKCIAERLLIEYCSATRDAGDRTEYIWLDEFCLSDANQPDNDPEDPESSVVLPISFATHPKLPYFVMRKIVTILPPHANGALDSSLSAKSYMLQPSSALPDSKNKTFTEDLCIPGDCPCFS